MTTKKDEEVEKGHDEDAAEAKPAGHERPRRKDEHHDEAHDHGHAHVEEPAEDSVAGWWMPHAVLGVFVVIGMLGFFGVFNGPLGFLRATPPPEAAEAEHKSEPAKTETKAAAPTPPAPQPPPQRPAPPTEQRETFGAKHLLVMYKGSLRAPPTITRTQDEAKKRAAEALVKAKKAGKDKFGDVVAEYSDEPGAAARGGSLGEFPKGAMVPEFQAAVEKLKVDEISDVVETKFGYHVILRTK